MIDLHSDPIRRARLGVYARLLAAFALLGMATSCNQTPMRVEPPRVEFTRPPPPVMQDSAIGEDDSAPIRSTQIKNNPGVPAAAAPPPAANRGRKLQGDTVTGSFDQMPLPAFVNAVFGDLLKVNFQMDPQVAARQDLVTLRTGGPRTPDEMLAVTREVLASYGIQVSQVGDVFRITPSDVLAAQAPEIIISRALPDVPTDLRPIFQVVPVDQVTAGTITNLLIPIFGQKTKMQPLQGTNAIVMMGLPQDIRLAMQAIRDLDRPMNAGRRSIRIEPVYWTANQLATRLIDIAKVNGYGAAAGPMPEAINFLPVAQVNAILVFAEDQKTLDFVANWARTLDQPSEAEDAKRYFVYFIKNTKARDVAETVRSVVSGQASGPTQQQRVQAQVLAQANAANAGAAAPPPAADAGGPNSGASSGIIVDEARNALIFTGSASEWAKIRPLIETLDRAVREALIEVTVIEVKLTDATQFGVEWLLRTAPTGATGVFGTIGTLGSAASAPQGGLTVKIFDGSDVRAVLRAYAAGGRLNVVSNPRVLARSGGEAKIQIGDDVPIITSQGQSSIVGSSGSSGILQTIQYRTTGIVMSVKPTIHAGRRVDLDVTQEVSDPQANSYGGTQSPTISTRKVTTQLTVQDGQTVLIGGLIKQKRTSDDAGVPILKDLPLIGQAFRSNTDANERQELIILITPYIVQSDEDLQVMTDAFRRRIESFGQDDRTNLPSLLRP